MYLAIPGITEMWPILVVVLIFFGAKKLPGLARAMGSSVSQFKKGLQDEPQAEELSEGASEDDSQETKV
jgi:sec-independent protein translocase protein TatA